MAIFMKPAFDFQAALSRLPDQPGIYRMYGNPTRSEDLAGTPSSGLKRSETTAPGFKRSDAGVSASSDVLLYVGKAKNLKNRVRTYFQNQANMAPKVQALMSHVTRFDYIVTDSEIEALILEYNLIKQYRPKYNILLKDDKKFPWIGLSAEPFPRLFITRDPSGRGRFFGPYVNSGNMYKTLQVLRKHFPLRQRRKPLFKNRPCMNYHIGACSGPCQNLVTEEEYAEVVRQVEMLLKGKADDLLERLEAEMVKASEDLNFELAAKLRDRYMAVQDVVSQQKMYYPDVRVSQDIVAAASDPRRCAITVLQIRRGKLIGSRPHEILLTHHAMAEEAYAAFLTQYYQEEEPDDLPDEVILQYPIEDEAVLQELLSGKKGKKVTLIHPQKGTKKEMLDLAVKNATETLEQAQTLEAKNYRNDPARALMALQETLGLPELPTRMECYDISHFQGSQTVASMVVFTNGVPDKNEYRRFKINTAEGAPDDFRSMHEVITRRFKRALESKPDGGPSWEAPELVIIDGGKGQLSSAVAALRELGVKDQPIISLAKKFEEVYLPGESRPILLPRDSEALFVLQQIRDEAHRFAITYHRSLRGKAAKTSVLDEIPGIGEKRKQKLLAHFGSVKKIRDATLEELVAMPGLGQTAAQSIYAAFHAQSAD
jgi:excinuclease ABC subunit C